MKSNEKQHLKKDLLEFKERFSPLPDEDDPELITEDDVADAIGDWDVKSWLREQGARDAEGDERDAEWM